MIVLEGASEIVDSRFAGPVQWSRSGIKNDYRDQQVACRRSSPIDGKTHEGLNAPAVVGYVFLSKWIGRRATARDKTTSLYGPGGSFRFRGQS